MQHVNLPKTGCWLFAPNIELLFVLPNNEDPVLVLVPNVDVPNKPPGLFVFVFPNKLPPVMMEYVNDYSSITSKFNIYLTRY